MIRRLAAGAAIGAFFLWLALRNVHFSEIVGTLRSVSLPAFGLFILMHLASYVLRAVRWRILVLPIADIPARRLMSPLMIGFMVNFLFPGRAGEVVRAWLLGRREKVSASATFATVVVERLFDGLAVLFLLAPASFLLPASNTVLLARVRWGGLVMLGVYVLILTALYFLGHHREAFSSFLARHPFVQRRPLAGRIVHFLERFLGGLGVLRSWRAVAGVVALSLVTWCWAALANLLMMRAIGLDLPGYAPVLLVVFQALGVLIPSPGFVGPFQYAHVVALGIYGVSEPVALSLALLIHAGIFIAVLAPGFWFAAREHLGLRDLTQATQSDTR